MFSAESAAIMNLRQLFMSAW